jgi:hypothetical protein
VTVHSGDMGYTSGLCRSAKCRGRSVIGWMNASVSWPRLLEGEKMAPLCREFDISRKTGYKLFDRYKDFGLVALTDRSRLGRSLGRPVSFRQRHGKNRKPTQRLRRRSCPLLCGHLNH